MTKTIQVNGKRDVPIEILREGDSADVIYSAFKPYGVAFEGQHKLFEEIKGDSIRVSTLLFFPRTCFKGDKSFSEKFVLYDDGEEPAQSMISPKLIPSNRTSKEWQ